MVEVPTICDITLSRSQRVERVDHSGTYKVCGSTLDAPSIIHGAELTLEDFFEVVA